MLTTLRNILARWFGPQSPPSATDTDTTAENGEILRSTAKTEEIHPETVEAHAAHPVPYDENLLERARTQWQFGDWQSLAKLDRDTLQHHPDRAKLALLAAAGHLQTDNASQARQFVRLAQDWGVSKKLVSQVLIAGVHNSLGRAAAVIGSQPRALKHFESAIVIGTPGSDRRLLTQARINEQFTQLGLPTPSTSALPPAPAFLARQSH